MKAKPRKYQSELTALLPDRLYPGSGLPPTSDGSGGYLDTHGAPDDLLSDPLSRADHLADGENCRLAQDIRTALGNRKPIDGGVPSLRVDVADVSKQAQYSRRNAGEWRLRVQLHLAPERNSLYIGRCLAHLKQDSSALRSGELPAVHSMEV